MKPLKVGKPGEQMGGVAKHSLQLAKLPSIVQRKAWDYRGTGIHGFQTCSLQPSLMLLRQNVQEPAKNAF